MMSPFEPSRPHGVQPERHDGQSDLSSAVFEQRDIFSLEADAAGLVLQYEYTYGDRLLRAGWERFSGETFYEIEAVKEAGEYLTRAFTGGFQSDDGFAQHDDPKSVRDSQYAADALSPYQFSRQEVSVDPRLEGFDVSRKATYVRQGVSNADVVALYEVKPERPVESPHWAFPDVLENSRDEFGAHLELLNPVFVQVACIDGVTMHRLVFSEKAGEELIDLATRDLSRMPNEFLDRLKEQFLRIGESQGVEAATGLSPSDLHIRVLDSLPEQGEVIVEAHPLGVYCLVMHYDPATSKVVTSAGRVRGAH